MPLTIINNENVQSYIDKLLINPYRILIDLNPTKTANDNEYRWVTLADAIKGGYKFNFDYDIKKEPQEKFLPEVIVNAPIKSYPVGGGEIRPFNSEKEAIQYVLEHPKDDPSENILNNIMAGGIGGLRGGVFSWLNKNVLPYTTARGWLSATLAVGNTPAWLTPKVAAGIDATLIGVPTGASIYDMYLNGPNVGNVTGTALGTIGLGVEAWPTLVEGYTALKPIVRSYRLSRAMNSALSSELLIGTKPYMIPELFKFSPDLGIVTHADKGNFRGAFTGHGAYVLDGFLYPGQTRLSGLRNFTWWNENELFSPGFNNKTPYSRIFLARKSDIPGLLRVREMNEPVGLWRPGSRKSFVKKSEMVTSEPTNISYTTLYNLDPYEASLGNRVYVRLDIPTTSVYNLESLSYYNPTEVQLGVETLGIHKTTETGPVTGSRNVNNPLNPGPIEIGPSRTVVSSEVVPKEKLQVENASQYYLFPRGLYMPNGIQFDRNINMKLGIRPDIKRKWIAKGIGPNGKDLLVLDYTTSKWPVDMFNGRWLSNKESNWMWTDLQKVPITLYHKSGGKLNEKD